MPELQVIKGPFNNPEELLSAWQQTIALLDRYDDQSIARALVSQVISAKHDEWWEDPSPEYPVIAEIASIALSIETPNGELPWRAQQWERINHLIENF